MEDQPRITPFLLQGGTAHAAFIVLPGGGYGQRADHEGDPLAEWFNSIGISAFVLDYRVAPYRHPVPLTDAQRAIRLVRSRAVEWRIDPARIGILGFSAGGHLALSAATIFDAGASAAEDPIDRASCRPNAAIACYPVVSFAEHRHDGSMRNLLGDNPDEPMRRSLSIETRVTAQTPPMFIWHTADDKAVPVHNALLLAGALAKHNVPFALHVFQSGPHGLGLARSVPDVQQWTALCANWLTANGFRR